MENNEILNELAMAMGNIIENKVAEKTKELEENAKSSINADAIIDAINNVEIDCSDIDRILSAIRDNYESEMEDAAKSFVDDNCSDYVKEEDIDASWVSEHLSEDEQKGFVKDYIDYNL